VYTGTLVQNKYKKLNYKSKKMITVDPSLWIKTPNAHEAIISQEVFDKMQRLLEVTAHLKPSKHRYLLSGLLRCHDCGSYISLTKKDKKYGWIYGRCGRYIQYHRFGLCTPHSFNYTKLEAHIIEQLRDLCQNFKFDTPPAEKRDNSARIKLLENEIAKIRAKIDIIYEDRLTGVITPEDFKRMSAKFNTEIDALTKQLDEAKQTPKAQATKKEREQAIKDFLAMTSPTQALMAQLIDRIEVKEAREFDVFFTFMNVG
jgi:hypothetical protein